MAKRALFVCIKNTSRSPMAEAMLRRLGEGGTQSSPVWSNHMARS